MPLITLFEHQRSLYRDLGLAPDHPGLEHIERMNHAHGAEMLRVGRHHLGATQFVGVWRAGDLVVQVLPKIDYGSVGDAQTDSGTPAYAQAVHTATRNLLRMLAVAGGFPVREQDLAPLLTQEHDWLDLLTWLLAVGLHRQLQVGLERQYVRQEDDLPVIRGRWQLAQQLARRPHVRHRFDVAYDEFLEDTLLNRVFRYAAVKLQAVTRQATTRRLLADISEWLDGTTRLHHSPRALLDRVFFTRLNERFLPSFRLARLFLENRAFELTAGDQDLMAFTFEMPRLFEAFVGRLLVDHRRTLLPDKMTGARVRLQSEGRTLYLAQRLPEDKNVFELRPDVLIEALGGQVLLVLDTKYKRLEAAQRRLGVDQGDVYQMLAYAQRLACPHLLLLYPQSADKPVSPVIFEVIGSPVRLMVAAVELRRPLDQLAPVLDDLASILRQAIPAP